MKVKNIFHRVFLVTFSERYDLAMHFLRYQEFYESPKYKGKRFSLLEFMEWYAKLYGHGAFSYPTDWSGFNIPGQIIKKVHEAVIPDPNHYDKTMLKLYSDCFLKVGDGNFYIIGTEDSGSKSTLNHETAHALFCVDKNYRKEAKMLVATMDQGTYRTMKENLLRKGYHKSVLTDEIQAYMVESKKDTRFGKLFEKFVGIHLEFKARTNINSKKSPNSRSFYSSERVRNI